MSRRSAFQFLLTYCILSEENTPDGTVQNSVWKECVEMMEAEKDFHLALFDNRQGKETA